MPMDKLDSIVIGEVTKRILQPDHLVALLDEYLRTAIEREGRNRDRFRQMRQDHKETEAGIARLLRLVEKGLMDAEDALMCERLVSLRVKRRSKGTPDRRRRGTPFSDNMMLVC